MARFNSALRKMILELLMRSENAAGIPDGPGAWAAFVRGGGNEMQPTTPEMRRRVLTGGDRPPRTSEEYAMPLRRALMHATDNDLRESYARYNYSPIRRSAGGQGWEIFDELPYDAADQMTHGFRMDYFPEELYGHNLGYTVRRPYFTDIPHKRGNAGAVNEGDLPDYMKAALHQYYGRSLLGGTYHINDLADALARAATSPQGINVPWAVRAYDPVSGVTARLLSIMGSANNNPYIRHGSALRGGEGTGPGQLYYDHMGSYDPLVEVPAKGGRAVNDDPFLYAVPPGLLGALATAMSEERI